MARLDRAEDVVAMADPNQMNQGFIRRKDDTAQDNGATLDAFIKLSRQTDRGTSASGR